MIVGSPAYLHIAVVNIGVSWRQQIHNGGVYDMTWLDGAANDGRRLLTASTDQTIRLWDLETTVCI
jgi:WD40 repeat protein